MENLTAEQMQAELDKISEKMIRGELTPDDVMRIVALQGLILSKELSK